MAEKAAELTIVMRLRNLIKGELAKAGKQIQQQISNIQKYQKEIRLASKLAVGVGVIGATLFTGAIVQAASFEKQMSAVSAITKASVDDQKLLRDAAIEQGSESVFSASQAAKAQELLGQSGQKTREIIASLPSVLELAAAGQTDLAFAAELSSSTLKQFSLDADESSRVSNVLAASSSTSLATLEKLGFALRQAGPDAAAFDQSLEGTVATISSFIDLGLRGEQAGTVFRAALVSLAKPSAEAQEILDRLGIQVFDTSGKMLPFVDIVEQLEEASLNTTDAFTIFGTEAGGKMAKLVGKGADALREMEKNVTGTNEATRQAKERTDNLAGSYTLLTSAIEGASISVGSEYIPIIRLATDVLTGFVSEFNSFDPVTKSLIANIALAVVGLTGFAGALGLVVVALATTKLALGVLALSVASLILLLGKAALAIGVLIAAFSFGPAIAEFKPLQNVAVAFFEFFHRGWLGLAVVSNSVIAAIALGLQKTFQALRSTVLKPLDLIFEALKKIIKSIDTNPFDVIENGLNGLQQHTEQVVVNVVKELNKQSKEYGEIHDNINRVKDAQEPLKDAIDKTTKAIDGQTEKVGKLADAHVKAFEKFQKAVVLPEKLKEAFDLVGLVSTADSVAEMDKLVSATGLLLESGDLTLEQERELIKVFTEKANAISGVTKRFDGMTQAASGYNAALDSLLAIRLNGLQDGLEKTLEGIIDPTKIKKKTKEVEKILFAFSNNTEGANGVALRQIEKGRIFDDEALNDFRKRRDAGENVFLSVKQSNEGLVASITEASEGYANLSFAIGATENKIAEIRGAVRGHQDQLDDLFEGPINAQLEYVDKLNDSGASLAEVAEAESRLKEIQSARVSSMIASEEAGLREIKKLRDANLKDIEENNKKIADLEKSRLDIADNLKAIQLQRSEAGLGREEKQRREFVRLNRELTFQVPALNDEKQAAALSRIAERAQALAGSAKEGGNEFNNALNLAERALKRLDVLRNFQISQGKATGLEQDAEQFKTAVASMDESIDGFGQKLKALQTQIANSQLMLAVDLLDNATGPGTEIRNELQDLFNTPIIQEVIVKQTAQVARGGFIKKDNPFSDGIEFQASSRDATGFGAGVVAVTPKAPDSFARGVNYISHDALVKVHKGEKILSRTDADNFRGGSSSGRVVNFNGDIIVQPATSTEAPQVTAQRLREELRKLDDMDKG